VAPFVACMVLFYTLDILILAFMPSCNTMIFQSQYGVTDMDHIIGQPHSIYVPTCYATLKGNINCLYTYTHVRLHSDKNISSDLKLFHVSVTVIYDAWDRLITLQIELDCLVKTTVNLQNNAIFMVSFVAASSFFLHSLL